MSDKQEPSDQDPGPGQRPDGPYRAATRLYVNTGLSADAVVELGADQSHYLQHVLRCKPGDQVNLFNGRDGEWRAEIIELRKGRGRLTARHLLRAQQVSPDLWLIFAPVKRARLDYMVQKAVELGVSALLPVVTRFTMVERIKAERLVANAIEAAEQCDRLDVPEIHDPVTLPVLVDGWDPARNLLFCDEGGDARPLLRALGEGPRGPGAVIIGPEGGFHMDERLLLRRQDWVTPVTLGPRILRSDTAAVVALSLWQSVLGDWS